MTYRPLLLLAALLVAGCSSTEDAALPLVPGLAVIESQASVDASFSRLVSALEDAGPVGVVATVDHAANAAAAGLDLRPTRVVLFGNPALGTPLMQANPLAGLDLPQKMLVYEDSEGRTVVGYSTTDYLERRHGLEDVGSLGDIERALGSFARTAAGVETGVINELTATDVAEGEGVVTVESLDGVDVTYGRLLDAIEGNPNLTVVAELDHQANAARVGLDLGPIRLVVFGNPALGTPLTQRGQTVGIDLPQKMLVYQDTDGTARVAYNDPGYLAERHDLGSPSQIATIRDALALLASVATVDE